MLFDNYYYFVNVIFLFMPTIKRKKDKNNTATVSVHMCQNFYLFQSQSPVKVTV